MSAFSSTAFDQGAYSVNAFDFGAGGDVPDQFTFTDVFNVPLSTQETSNTITVTGMGTGVSVAVSVTGGTYSKNAGLYTSSAGTAQNGDTFSVRHTSAATYNTSTNTTLTISSVSDTYTSVTLADPSGVPVAGGSSGSTMGISVTIQGPAVPVAHLGIELKH